MEVPAQEAEEEPTTSPLHHIRQDPGRIGLATMLEEMAKLRRIRELKLPENLFPGLARKVLMIYRNRASIEEPSRLRAHHPEKRLTLLAILCFMRSQEITDGLVDLLIHIVHKIDVRAEKRVEQEYVNEFKRVANKEGILYRIAEAAVEHPNEPVSKVVFPVASEKLLRDVIQEVVAAKWREFVVEEDGETTRVNRLNYEVCVAGVARKGAIVGANRYRNPDDDLPTDFSQKRATYCEAIHQPTEADKFIEQIKEGMRKGLRSLDTAMPHMGDKVRLLPKRKKPISIAPLAAQPEPQNLLSLKQEVGTRWSMTSLLDILKETALRTGFPDLLTSVASRERLPRDVLHRRLLLCLYGLGTNTGFKRLPGADPGTSYSDLRYARSRYIHKEQLRNAIAQFWFQPWANPVLGACCA